MTRDTGNGAARVRSALVGFAVAAPFYWLLIDTTSAPELVAGAVAAVIAAAAYSAARLESTANAVIRPRWLMVALLELTRVPRGTWTVCAAVLAQTVAPRRRRGELQVEPFQASTDESHDLGRRAVAEAFGSLAPNTIVIGADPDSGRLILHRLGRRA